MQVDNREQKARLMGEGDIAKILTKLAIPGIIAMLINAIYNVVDTMFVGQLQNTSAIAAVAIAFPLFMLIAAVGQMFGVGAASYISRLLGENNKKQADKTSSTTFFTALAFGIIFTIIGLLYMENILRFFGASDTVLTYAYDYGIILMTGSVFTILNMTMNNMIRAEGNAKYSMFAISLGAVINIILDPIIMFRFGMGVKGAALATVIAQFISTIFLISYYLFGKSYVKISVKGFKPSLNIYNEMLRIGSATFARQALASLAMGLINTAAKPYGDAAVASMGVSLRVFTIAIFVVLGYCQGFQPIAGYNYGAKKYRRLREAIKVSFIRLTVFSSVCAFIFLVFAEKIIMGFSSDPEVIKIGTDILRAMSILLPFMGFQQLYAALYQALGKGTEAMILSISRQGIFLIPAILILPKIFNLNGVIFAQPLADLCTIIITAFLSVKLSKQFKDADYLYEKLCEE